MSILSTWQCWFLTSNPVELGKLLPENTLKGLLIPTLEEGETDTVTLRRHTAPFLSSLTYEGTQLSVFSKYEMSVGIHVHLHYTVFCVAFQCFS